MYAAVRIGAVTALINTSLHRKELKNVLERTDIRWLTIGDGFKDLRYTVICQGLVEELPHLESIAYIGQSGDQGGFPSARQCGMSSQEELRRAESYVTPDDTAFVIYTSGTTSIPKAC